MFRESAQNKERIMKQSVASLVGMRGVSFIYGNHRIFNNISLAVSRGKIMAIMGPSGIGKTTLLHLIDGQAAPDHGEILLDSENTPVVSRSCLYTVRKRMSMLFQSRALFTDMNVFGNVAYPSCEHIQLPAPLLHSMAVVKLKAAGLCGAARLMPSELSGGAVRRVALARAVVLESDLIMFDEPFAGQDLTTIGILAKLISELGNALGVTRVVVSHDVPEVLSIVDHVWILVDKKTVVHGSAQALQVNPDPCARRFLGGIADGPTPFRHPTDDHHADLLPGGQAAHAVKYAGIART